MKARIAGLLLLHWTTKRLDICRRIKRSSMMWSVALPIEILPFRRNSLINHWCLTLFNHCVALRPYPSKHPRLIRSSSSPHVASTPRPRVEVVQVPAGMVLIARNEAAELTQHHWEVNEPVEGLFSHLLLSRTRLGWAPFLEK